MLLLSKKKIKTNERTLAISCIFLWVFFVGLAHHIDFNLLQNSIGFLFLVSVPGILFLQNFRIAFRFDWTYIGLAVGLSLVIVMAFGLLINFVLPNFGLVPLVEYTLQFSILCLIILLSTFLLYRNETITIKKRAFNKVVFGFVSYSVLLVIVSICGALRLNNGYSGNVTLTMLCAMAVGFVVILYFNKDIKNGLLETVFYFFSLALLLMTSLRGWGIVGHDIQRESRVFQMTKEAGVWSIDYLQDAYNACMSVTILPTMFSELLSIPDAYIYKFLFQLIFALVPVLSFILISRYFSKFIAILSTILIISFPTFFTDMPMLNRQEIAFLMFVLLILVMFDRAIGTRFRNTLILLFGVGIILSHYSTTYIVILFLTTAWFGFLFTKIIFKVKFVSDFVENKKFLKPSFALPKTPAISILSLGAIIILSFVWSSVFTQTSDSSIKRVLVRTFESVVFDSESTKSVDTLYGLFSSKKMTKDEVLAQYRTDVVEKARKNDPGIFFQGDIVENYTPIILPDEVLPLTNFGKKIEALGISVGWLNVTLKFGTAKVLQVLLLVGIVVSLFSAHHFRNKPPVEYILLVIAGVAFLASMVLIPVLSVEYGVLRAFQQTLFIAAPIIIIGGLYVFRIFGEQFAKFMTAAFIILFFLTSTGVITQFTGGYKALLHLNNSGPYYDNYYIHGSEVSAFVWINDQIEQSESSEFLSELQADHYFSKKLSEKSNLSTPSGTYPGLISKNAYVFLGHHNVNRGNSTIFYSGTTLTFKYPFSIVERYKNKVYDSEGVVIYR